MSPCWSSLGAGELRAVGGGAQGPDRRCHARPAILARLQHHDFAVDDISSLPWSHPHSGRFGPTFARGLLDIDEPADTFVEVPLGVKGYGVNGFLLGRYWTVGPQKRLYLPWPLVHRGRNEFTVLELGGVPITSLTLHPNPTPTH